MPRTSRAHWAGLIGGVAVIVVGAAVAPRLIPAPDLTENRPLAGPPGPIDGPGGLAAFRAQTDAFVADHFPPRVHLIGALNRLRMLFGVSGSPTVIVGRQGWLFSDDGSHLGAARGDPPMTDRELRDWLTSLAGRSEALRKEGVAYAVLAAPVKEAIYPEMAPGWFDLDPNRPAAILSRLAQASGAPNLVYPDAPIAQQARWGLKTYVPYETHWTGLGAYHGYVALMRELHRQGATEEPRPLESFQEIRVGETPKPRNLALMLGVASFVDAEYPEIADPREPALQIRYLGERHDWTGLRVIETGQVGKPVLLMTLDSFSNALLPFLYSHFSRLVLAHNQDGVWRPDLIAQFHPDVVVSEVVESGLPYVMRAAPPASAEAAGRIRQAVAERRRYEFSRLKDAPPRRQEGSPGPDHLFGHVGRDDIRGRQGDDIIEGLGGDDSLSGGRGADTLDGGDGADWLVGGRGDDLLRGGAGPDTFNIFAGAGNDEVADFSIAEGDHVEVDDNAPFTVRQVGPDTVVELADARLILRGVKAATLPLGWIRSRLS